MTGRNTAPAFRVVAMALDYRGLGFMAFEGRQALGWGTSRSRTMEELLKRAAVPIAIYRPKALVLEEPGSTRRREAVRERLRLLGERAAATPLHVQWTRRQDAERLLGETAKWAVAEKVAQRYPGLRPWLPPPRKFHDSEASRMLIFEAAALGLAALEELERRWGNN